VGGKKYWVIQGGGS